MRYSSNSNMNRKKINIKNFKAVAIILIIVAVIVGILAPNKNYAVDSNEIFEVSSQTASCNSSINLKINLNKIEYSNYKIAITSNVDMNNMTTENEGLNIQKIESNENAEDSVNQGNQLSDGNSSSESNVADNKENEANTTGESIEKDNDSTICNEINMTIDKSSVNISNILLDYTIPSTMAVSQQIKFAMTVTDLNSESSSVTEEQSITIVEQTDENQDNKGSQEAGNNGSQSSIESGSGLDNNNMGQKSDNSGNQNFDESVQGLNAANMSGTFGSNSNGNSFNSSNNNMTGMQSSGTQTMAVSNGGNATTTDSDTYNGACNNYLQELEVDGYTFTENFEKENTTYFINASSTDDLNITAVAEDENATVYTYSGTDKILISVTAENGNVRTYRILLI